MGLVEESRTKGGENEEREKNWRKKIGKESGKNWKII